MSAGKYRITLDQLRMASRTSKRREIRPSAVPLTKVLNSLEAADFSIRPIAKYVKELERAVDVEATEDRKKGRASTLYYLSQYLKPKSLR